MFCNTAFSQCLDLSDTTIVVQHTATKIDFEGLLKKEKKPGDEFGVTLRIVDGYNVGMYGFQQGWGEDFLYNIEVNGFAIGSYSSTLKRSYFNSNTGLRSCVDTVIVRIDHPNDRRFDSIGTASIRVGTGAGSLMFTNSRRGLFRKDGFNLDFFSNFGGSNTIWIGGLDTNGVPHLAGQFVASVEFHNSLPGPSDIDKQQSTDFNRVWKLLPNDLQGSTHANYPIEYANVDGDRVLLMHYVDADSNNIWNNGTDYPCLYGDEMLFTSYHFPTEVTEPWISGTQFPATVRQYLFTYKKRELSNVLFGRFEITNHSDQKYDSVFIGMNSSLQAHQSYYDKVGCDTTQNAFYSYVPKSENKGEKYEGKEPALGIVFLNRKLDVHVPYHKDPFGCVGFTHNTTERYHYLSGRSRYGAPFYDHTYQCVDSLGKDTTTRLFPGNPFDTTVQGGVHMNHDEFQSLPNFSVG